MKERKLQLVDGSTMTINDNEWQSVINRKEFDANSTEILRVTRHSSGLLTRVYAMRSLNGKVVAEENRVIVSDSPAQAITEAIASVGLTRITG